MVSQTENNLSGRLRWSCPQDPLEKPLTQKVRGFESLSLRLIAPILGAFLMFGTYILKSNKELYLKSPMRKKGCAPTLQEKK